MSVETDVLEVGVDGATVGVDLELTGALVARAGARQGRVLVSEGSTLADAVRTWADQYGDQVRFALLDGDRLSSEVLAVRVSDGGEERLVASEPVFDGDAVRFRFRD